MTTSNGRHGHATFLEVGCDQCINDRGPLAEPEPAPATPAGFDHTEDTTGQDDDLDCGWVYVGAEVSVRMDFNKDTPGEFTEYRWATITWFSGTEIEVTFTDCDGNERGKEIMPLPNDRISLRPE